MQCVVHKKTNEIIQHDKKFKRLGYFEKLEDAIVARKGAEKKYFGEFAPQEGKRNHAGDSAGTSNMCTDGGGVNAQATRK